MATLHFPYLVTKCGIGVPWLEMIPRPSERLFMSIVCHLDDSGEKRDPVVTLAGYVGTVDGWAAFEREARAYFDHHGICYLHTMELYRRHGEFKGWDSRQTFLFAQGLFEILGRHSQIGFEFSVLKEPFNRNKGVYKVNREGTPKTFCFKGLVQQIMTDPAISNALAIDGVDLSFVIESGPGSNPILLEFQRLSKLMPKLRSITFEDKKKFIGLQVSDFLAFFTRRLRCQPTTAASYATDQEFFLNVTRSVVVHRHMLAVDFHVT